MLEQRAVLDLSNPHRYHSIGASIRKVGLRLLASVALWTMPAVLTWAQDQLDCQPGFHLEGAKIITGPGGGPILVGGHCVKDATGTIFVNWQNFRGSQETKSSGTDNGTASNPYRTVRRAIKGARPGDTLLIKNGFYNAEETLVFDKAVSVRAEGGPVTIYAHRIDDILTLIPTDVPGDQPPVDKEQSCQGGLYFQGGFVPNEWMQPGGAENLPAIGRVADKSEPNNDARWDHPFGFDYWWDVAIDDERYLSLLNRLTLASTMDCSPEGISQKLGENDTCHARFTAQNETGRDTKGILHTEIEERLLPVPYRPLPGDRVYMRGHRIADCGHDPVGAEMHPPTLVVAARIWPDDGSLRTTLFAMPYVTTQTYELGKDLPTAVTGAVVAASISPIGLPTGLPLIAHTSSRPFNVPIIAKYRVAVPSVPRRATASDLHYHFVTRPGVKVSVTPIDGFSADVDVQMDPAAYQPFSDAQCGKETVSLETLDQQWGKPQGTIRAGLNGFAGAFGFPPGLVLTFNAGMQVAVCQVPNSTPVAPWTINDNAVVTDTSQPYPVYGWLSYD